MHRGIERQHHACMKNHAKTRLSLLANGGSTRATRIAFYLSLFASIAIVLLR